MLEAFDDWTVPYTWAFIERFPDTQALLKAGRREWEKFLHTHKLWRPKTAPGRLAVLEAANETIHSASEWLASESGHIASEASGHDLHCFQALRRMDEILLANFMVFQEVVEEGGYDLVIGDEAWDIDYYWHENPELKRGSNVWLTEGVPPDTTVVLEKPKLRVRGARAPNEPPTYEI